MVAAAPAAAEKPNAKDRWKKAGEKIKEAIAAAPSDEAPPPPPPPPPVELQRSKSGSSKTLSPVKRQKSSEKT